MSWLDLESDILSEFSERAAFDVSDFLCHGLSQAISSQVLGQPDRPGTCAYCRGTIPESRKHRRVARFCSDTCKYSARQDAFEAAGMCNRCGKNAPQQGRVQCVGCAAKSSARQSARVAKRNNAGCCSKCNNAMDRGGTMCKSCCKSIRVYNCNVNPKKPKQVIMKKEDSMVGKKVMVTGCSSRDSNDAYLLLLPFIGRRGTILSVHSSAPEVEVKFRGCTKRFRPEELVELS